MVVMMEHGMIEADRINPERMNMDHGPGMAPMGHSHGDCITVYSQRHSV